jgi:hypothetical protein
MTGNGLTKYEGTEPPAPLPGRSAATMFLRGTIAVVGGASMIVPLVVAAAGHHDVGVYASLIVGLIAAAVGTVGSTMGLQKGRAEQRAGYATLPKIASVNPFLFLLDRRDFHVLLYPNQPRPRTRNRKDMDAWRARYNYPDSAGR